MNKFTKNVLAFSQGATSIFDKFVDYINHYRTEVEGKKGLVFDNNASFAAKDVEMNKDLLKLVESNVGRSKPTNMSFSVWANDPTVRYHTFAVVGAMVDAVLPTTLLDTIGVYADIRHGGFGDSFSFDIEPRDLFAISKAGRGKRTGFVQKQFGTTATLSPENHKITVQVSLYKVLSGVESLAKFTMKAVRSIETQLTYDAYDAMDVGLTGATIPNELKLAAYTQTGLINLAQRVTAWNGGNKAVIVGTQLALGKVLPSDSNYRYLLDSEYVTMGYVKEFNQFSVMALPQVADYTSSTFGLKLKDNMLYVLSPSADKLIKIGIEGETLTYVDDINANANLTQNATLNKSWATGLITSSIAGSVKLA